MGVGTCCLGYNIYGPACVVLGFSRLDESYLIKRDNMLQDCVSSIFIRILVNNLRSQLNKQNEPVTGTVQWILTLFMDNCDAGMA